MKPSIPATSEGKGMGHLLVEDRCWRSVGRRARRQRVQAADSAYEDNAKR